MEQLAERAFAFGELIGDRAEIRDRALEIGRGFLVEDERAEGALAEFDVIDDRLGVGDEGAGIGGDALDFADAGDQVVVHFRIVDEAAEGAFALVELSGDLLEVGHRRSDLFGIIGDDFVEFLEEAGRLAVAVDGTGDAAESAFEFFAEIAEFAHDGVDVGRDPGLDFGPVFERGGGGGAEVDADVVRADQAGHDDGGGGVTFDGDLRVDAEDGFGAPAGGCQIGLFDGADFYAGHAHFVALLELLQTLEASDERVAAIFENFTVTEGLEGDPDEGETEEEEKTDAGGVLGVVHGVKSPVS